MTLNERLALGRLVAFARRDGRQARREGKPALANPYRATAAKLQAAKLQAAWAEGWQAESNALHTGHD